VDSKAMIRMLNNLLKPLYRRIRLLVRRGVLVGSNSAPKMQTVQVQITPDLILEMEHFEPYGFSANPHDGAEPIVLNVEGKSHPVSLLVADRRYRLSGMEKGEVALSDDLGQKVHLKRDGHIEVIANTQLTINAPLVLINGELKTTGKITDLVDSTGQSMDGMRATYNDHNHSGDSGGSTSNPNQPMGS